MKHFFPTIPVNLPECEAKAKSQSELILEFLKENAGKEYTPLELVDHFKFDRNSIRRSLSVLHHSGMIARGGLKMERLGKPNHVYYYPVGQLKLI